MHKRVFAAELPVWPQVYQELNGDYEINAWHRGPNFYAGTVLMLAGWIGLGAAVKWVWDQSMVGGAAAAVAVLFPAYWFIGLAVERLTFSVQLDGAVFRKCGLRYHFIVRIDEDYSFQRMPPRGRGRIASKLFIGKGGQLRLIASFGHDRYALLAKILADTLEFTFDKVRQGPEFSMTIRPAETLDAPLQVQTPILAGDDYE